MKKVVILIVAFFALAAVALGQEQPPLRLIAKIPVPHMTGTWDHLTADAKRKRVFIAAQEDHKVEVVDLKTLKHIRTIEGGFNRPQGMFYVPQMKKLVVTSGRNGTLKVLDGDSFEVIKTIQLSLGADLMEYDKKSRYLYVDHGGKDSNRGPGKVAIIDTVKWELVGNIDTDFRPAAMVLEEKGSRLFVCLPGLNGVGVIDRSKQQLVSRLQAPGTERPVAVALDEANHRVFAGTRSPNKFIVFDSETGKIVQTLDAVGGISGMFFDPASKRVYVSGLDGVCEIYQEVDADHYKSLGKVPIRALAGTSLLIPELKRYIVAVPPHEKEVGEIWVYETLR
jgi:hypothetical protein